MPTLTQLTYRPVQHFGEVYLVRRRVSRSGGLHLTVIHTRLVQNALDHELHEAIVFRKHRLHRPRFFVPREELLHQWENLPEALDASFARVPVAILHVVAELGERQQQTQSRVFFLGRAKLFQLSQHLDHLLDGTLDIVDQRWSVEPARFRPDAQQLDVLVAQDRVPELLHVEVLQRLQRLDELHHVVPLPIEDELPQKEHIVRVLAVDDAGFALQRQL